MSENISASFGTQDVSATTCHGTSACTEIHKEPSYLSRKAYYPGAKRLNAQRSSSCLPPKEDSTHLNVLGSSSCLALHTNNSVTTKKDGEIPVASWNEDTVVNGKISKHIHAILAECRICQEEDDLSNLEIPCACTGSLKYAHRTCVQHWCNEKGDTLCEICRKPYEGGYTAPPSAVRSDSFPINIGDGWEITSTHRFDGHEPRIFAVTSEHLFSEAEYEAYYRANERSAVCFRSVALILMILLLLRHVLSITSTGTDEDSSTFFLLFILRTAGFFLPCYIMARALNVLQCRRQRQASDCCRFIIRLE
ncbi:hypothetical protein KP509_22G004900 [Ceratopteris richardii]|uniref:RING-CH-type domain-containing protein n=1 Tax=Ceratopteris richardii TaxID=49495 RepID=A0A8T2S353_CERRI|nr:hypothetical protein KP509_22G004900 [Ceratopteris richardii]